MHWEVGKIETDKKKSWKLISVYQISLKKIGKEGQKKLLEILLKWQKKWS